MDQFEWTYNTDRSIALQQVDSIKPGFALDIDEVLEVPAHEVIDTDDRTNGDMPRVVNVLRRVNALPRIRSSEIFDFSGYLEQEIPG